MPKVAPLKVVILPILVKMAKKRQRAGNSNWMQKVAPWRVAKKGENGDLGENEEFGTRAGDIRNVANILIGCHVAP